MWVMYIPYMFIGLHNIDRRTASGFWRSHTREPRGGCRGHVLLVASRTMAPLTINIIELYYFTNAIERLNSGVFQKK